jgi:hypothetical protein
MLKRPYELIYQKEINNYYLLPLPESNMIAVETVMKARGWFGREKDIPVGLQMIPLNSGLLAVFLEFLKLEQVGEKKIADDMPVIPLYDNINIKPIREKLKKIAKGIDVNFQYTPVVLNDTVKELINEGYQVLGINTIGSHAREVWLVKTNDFGTLHVMTVFLHGKPSVDSVGFAKLSLFDRALVTEILEVITDKKQMEELKND